jgi:hypothetical protein
VAEYLVQEILNHSRNNSQPEAQGSEENVSGTNSKRPSKRRKQLDHTYQRPRSSRPQPDISGPGDSDSAIEGRSLVDDDSVTCQSDLDDMTINQSSDSLMTDMPQPLQKCEAVIPEIVVKEVPYEGVQGQSTAHDHTIGNDSVKGNTVHRQPPVAVDESTEDNQTTRRPPSPCEAEQQETALPEIDVKVSSSISHLLTTRDRTA